MPKTYISDFEVGTPVRTSLMVRRKRLRQGQRGYFLELRLGDRTGEIEAKVWDNAPALAEEFEEFDVIAIEGQVEEWRDAPQLRIVKLRRLAESEVDLTDFLPRGEKDGEALWQRLQQTIASIGDAHLRGLLETIFADPEMARAFRLTPAAKALHHAYLGGLLEHTDEVVTLAEALAGVFPQVNRDLLVTAAILHDIGKTRELQYARAIDYTDAGRLVGHVVMGERMVSAAADAAPGFPPELKLQLSHALLSHHGQREFGAPTVPQTVEAIALHHVEDLGAKVKHFLEVLDKQTDATRAWSDYDKLYERYLYRRPVGEPENGDPDD